MLNKNNHFTTSGMVSILLLFIWLLIVSATYPLVNFSPCSGSSKIVGYAAIENNLLGDTLVLQFNWTTNVPLYVCTLCTQQPSYYHCNRSLLATQYTLTPKFVRTAILDDQNKLLSLTETSTLSNSLSIALPGGGECQRRLRVVLAIEAILNVSAPEMLSIENKITLSGTLKNVTLPCELLPSSMEFECQRTPSIEYLEYQLSNCLVTSVLKSDETASSGEIHSPLYWYTQYLTNSTEKRASHLTLCGEPLHTILYRSDLYLNQCDAFHTGEPIRSAWYRMAIQAVTVVCNDVREQYKWLWLHAVEILERHCDLRESELSDEAARESSLFMVISNRLDEANRIDVQKSGLENETQLCEMIREHFDATYTETMSEMLYNQWFYKGFKSILMPSADMKIYSILLISLLVALPIALLTFLSVIICRLKRKVKYEIQFI